MKFVAIAAIVLLVMSLIALCLYINDKSRAKRGAWRIPEKVLLGFGFFGGSLGALIGMKVFRHKTKHWYFWVVNIAGFIWQYAVLIWLLLHGLGVL